MKCTKFSCDGTLQKSCVVFIRSFYIAPLFWLSGDLGGILEGLEGILGGLGGILEGSWGNLGGCWGQLGGSRGDLWDLGVILG